MLAVAARETSKIKLGHFVTNPATRDPTVLASSYATLHDLSDGRMAMGIGRGDSAVRYIGRQPMKVAEFEQALRDDPRVHERPRGRLERQGAPAEVGARRSCREIPMWVAGYGPKALAVAGRVADGVIIQLADPEIIQWIMDTARRAAEEAGRDPAQLKCIVGAPSPRHRRPRRRARAGALVPGDGLEPRHGPDRALRHRRQLVPKALTDYVQAREVLRLQRPLARRRGARRVRHRRDLRPLLRPRRRPSRRRRSCRSSRRSASTSSTSTS